MIGSPIAGRTLRQSEGLIGLFVNTLPLRIRCQAGISFSDLLGQVRRTALDAYAHQDVPFEHLVERLRPERSLSHSPLFQVMFVFQNNEELAVQLPGLEIEPVAQDFPTAKQVADQLITLPIHSFVSQKDKVQLFVSNYRLVIRLSRVR